MLQTLSSVFVWQCLPNPMLIMDPPDSHNDATATAAQHADVETDSSRNKQSHQVKPALANIYFIVKDLQNCSGHWVGSELS